MTVGAHANCRVQLEIPDTRTDHNVVIEAHIPEDMQHRNGSVPWIHVSTLNAGELRQALLKPS